MLAPFVLAKHKSCIVGLETMVLCIWYSIYICLLKHVRIA